MSTQEPTPIWDSVVADFALEPRPGLSRIMADLTADQPRSSWWRRFVRRVGLGFVIGGES